MAAAKLRFAVLPLHSAREGRCSCGNPSCTSPGKHPIAKLAPQGVKSATKDPEAIRGFWQQDETANIGIATGTQSGICVLDVDERHGGGDSLATLFQEHGWINTPTVRTGNGFHLYFASPSNPLRSKAGFLPGLDLRSEGSYVVGPGSMHKSGATYEWIVSPNEKGFAPFPTWLSELARSGAEPMAAENGDRAPIPEGHRNVALTSIAGTMRKRGLSAESIEAALLVENRKRCSPPLAESEVRTIAVSIARYPTPNVLNMSTELGQGAAPSDVLVTRVSEIEARAVEWIWRNRIPRAMLTLCEGDPATGKSTFLLDIAARVSRGWKMPDEEGLGGGGKPGTVILLSAEDDAAAVIRPRLEAAGADLSRIILLTVPTPEGGERELSITDADIALVEAAALRESAVLVIVDPLTAYLTDSTDTNSDHSVRRALVKLKGLAERTGCAVVCVRHWRKSTSETALYRGGGSIAFIAAARSGLVVGYDPNDETRRRRVLACSKMNLAPLPPSLSFQPAVEPEHPFPRVRWEGISPHAADALSGATREKSAVDEAYDFLDDRIGDGEVPVKEIQNEARAEGIALRSVRRAKERMAKEGRLETVKDPSGAFWIWRRPQGGQHSLSARNGHLPRNDRADLGHLPMENRGDAYEDDLGGQL